jgi:archaellum biogenesis protein FlaJ (TadC family)
VRALRRWRSGLVVTAVCFLVGTVRLLATGSTGWATGVWFLVAAVYAFVALVARRLVVPERPEDWLGRSLWQDTAESPVRNRIANVVVTVAAVVGLLLVITDADAHHAEDRSGPVTGISARSAPGGSS